ncbi:MAG: hypothetical protein U0Q16_19220 [Bryobacteraceae bacterium]
MSAFLALLIFGGLLLAWGQGRWAVAAPQVGVCASTAVRMVRAVLAYERPQGSMRFAGEFTVRVE